MNMLKELWLDKRRSPACSFLHKKAMSVEASRFAFLRHIGPCEMKLWFMSRLGRA